MAGHQFPVPSCRRRCSSCLTLWLLPPPAHPPEEPLPENPHSYRLKPLWECRPTSARYSPVSLWPGRKTFGCAHEFPGYKTAGAAGSSPRSMSGFFTPPTMTLTWVLTKAEWRRKREPESVEAQAGYWSTRAVFGSRCTFSRRRRLGVCIHLGHHRDITWNSANPDAVRWDRELAHSNPYMHSIGAFSLDDTGPFDRLCRFGFEIKNQTQNWSAFSAEKKWFQIRKKQAIDRVSFRKLFLTHQWSTKDPQFILCFVYAGRCLWANSISRTGREQFWKQIRKQIFELPVHHVWIGGYDRRRNNFEMTTLTTFLNQRRHFEETFAT